MKFLSGAKVSKSVVVPDLGPGRGAAQHSGYNWSLGALPSVFECQPIPDSLGDLGRVSSL